MRRASSPLPAALAAAGAATISLLASVAMAAPAAATAAAEDIRDIRGPLAIAPWWRWPLVAVVAVLALAALAFAVRAWRARKLRAWTPLDRARQALTEAEEHAREGHCREWAELVAETTRTALAVKLGAQILPHTTPELAVALQARGGAETAIGGEDVVELLTLLASCDLARFAKARLDATALVAATATARALVERLYAPVSKTPSPALAASTLAPPPPSARSLPQQVTS
jgi:hypothetical protein